MAKLTNRQLDVLAARVVDLLEEQHKIDSAKLKETDEYKHFIAHYEDEITPILSRVQEKANKIKDLKTEISEIISKVSNTVGLNKWSPEHNQSVLEDYLKDKRNERFPTSVFNREKTLRRVEADIILGDVSNPEELIKSLVEKLK